MSFKNPNIGKYVIVRSYGAGVFFGKLKEQSKNCKIVVLNKCRRLWKWHAADGIALSGVAMRGLIYDENTKVDIMTNNHVITGVLEVIPCADTAVKSIMEANDD